MTYDDRRELRALLNMIEDLSATSPLWKDLEYALNNLIIYHASKLGRYQNTALDPTPMEIRIALGTETAIYAPGTPNKIFAIKLYQDRSGLSLKEAKDAIDKAIS